MEERGKGGEAGGVTMSYLHSLVATMLAIWTVVVNRKREVARFRRYFEGRADLTCKKRTWRKEKNQIILLGFGCDWLRNEMGAAN